MAKRSTFIATMIALLLSSTAVVFSQVVPSLVVPPARLRNQGSKLPRATTLAQPNYPMVDPAPDESSYSYEYYASPEWDKDGNEAKPPVETAKVEAPAENDEKFAADESSYSYEYYASPEWDEDRNEAKSLVETAKVKASAETDENFSLLSSIALSWNKFWSEKDTRAMGEHGYDAPSAVPGKDFLPPHDPWSPPSVDEEASIVLSYY